MTEKETLRAILKQRIPSLSKAYCDAADQSIVKQVLDLPAYQEAKTIFCFVGMEREIHTMPILLDALQSGKVLGVPLCVNRGIMEVRRIQGLEELEMGAYGILEPIEATPVICPEKIHLAIVPCLSCSEDGRRLGYGGGYYDRYLPRISGKTCVICRKQMMCETIPVEPHDWRMDTVVYEKD